MTSVPSSLIDSDLRVDASTDAPAALVDLGGLAAFGRPDIGLVEIFTADEQRGRTSQGYIRSAVGTRLRASRVEQSTVPGAEVTSVTQRDAVSGLEVSTTLTRPHDTGAVRVQTAVTNTSDRTVVLTAVTSATVGFGREESDLDHFSLTTGESEWLAEGRWSTLPLRRVLPRLSLGFHGQDGRGHHGITSHGAWSSGERMPGGILVDERTGAALAWQIEAAAGWHVDLAQMRGGGVLSLLGPTDLEHQFAHALAPGATFEAVPVTIAVSPAGLAGAAAELTAARRYLRGARAQSEGLPIVYNDFMNTLMGEPSTEKLQPLIDAAADAGAEVFCIDAGWFADPAAGDWWSTVGEWIEAPTRFTGGLRGVIDQIHARGMRSGLWLEPEVVGVDSPAATTLPEDAFFHRFGTRVREHDRYHLDFRHPAAVAHLDEVVDRLVAEYGISYLKLDYNINPGAGTQWRATGAGDGLLGHARAFVDWLVDVRERHPGLLLENCSSGAMRMDYSLLAVTHLQSTTDQQDFALYPPVAASAPLAILPEQCGNWAYPAAHMTDEETAFTLVTGLSGRLYLSGFLHDLRPAQRELVREAVALHAHWRALLPEAVPFWPLGLPQWDDDVVCLGLRGAEETLLFVWDRSAEPSLVVLPDVAGAVEQLFPAAQNRDAIGATDPDAIDPWAITVQDGVARLRTQPGATARVLRIANGGAQR